MKPYLQLHGLVLIVAFTAVLGQLISLPAPTLVIWRTGIAASVFFLILRPKSQQVIHGFHQKALLTGVILGLHWITFFGSIKLSNISICLTGLATLSLFTSLAEAIQERRLPYKREVLLSLIIISALILIAGVSTNHLGGLLCALASSALAATFTVMNKTLVRAGSSASSITQFEMLGAALTCLLSSLLLRTPPIDYLPKGMDWLWLSLLSLICTVYAFTLNVKLLKYFSAFEASLASNLEPVYGILLAALIFKEHQQMHPLFFLGTAMILLANFIDPILSRFNKLRRQKI